MSLTAGDTLDFEVGSGGTTVTQWNNVIAFDAQVTACSALGLTGCGNACVNLTSDANNCGACGDVCATSDPNASGSSCVSGACMAECNAGYVLCNGTCVNEQSDRNNCGGCGVACAATESCQSGACVPEVIYVLFRAGSGVEVVEMDTAGNLLNQFGVRSDSNSYYSHLAFVGGTLYRTLNFGNCQSGATPGSIDEFWPSGTLLGTITPSTSVVGAYQAIAGDYTGQSATFVDLCAGSNVVYDLLAPTTGTFDTFATLSYNGSAGVQDLYFGGPAGSQALYAYGVTSPYFTVPYSSRLARLDAQGNITYIDSPDLALPYANNVGSVAVSSVDGSVFAATSTLVVQFDASGNEIGTFPFVDTLPSLDVDPAGNVFVGSFNTGAISVYAPGGSLLQTIASPIAGGTLLDIVVVSGP